MLENLKAYIKEIKKVLKALGNRILKKCNRCNSYNSIPIPIFSSNLRLYFEVNIFTISEVYS